MSEQSVKGFLQDRSFAEIYYDIYANNRSGVVLISLEKVKKEIHFLRGVPVFIQSNIASEAFGKYLVSKNVVDQPTLDRILKEKPGGAQLGGVLISKNLISTSQLNHLLAEHLRIKLEQAFLWTKGEYEFLENASISQNHMIADFAKEHHFWPCYRRAMNPKIRQVKLAMLFDKRISVSPHDVEIGLSGTEMKALRELCDELAGDTLLNSLNKIAVQRELKEQLLCFYHDLKWIIFEVSEDEKKVIQLREKIKSLKDMDHFQVLGLPFNADIALVKKTYFELAKKLHPDKIRATADPEYAKLMEEYFSNLTIAHRVLTDPSERNEYVTALQMTRDGSLERMQQALGSEEHFEKAKIAIRGKNFESAKAELESAIKMNPEDAEYWADLGWCLFNLFSRIKADPNGKEMKQVEDTLKKAVGIKNDLGNTYYYLGCLYLYRQNDHEAEISFEKCIQVMPHHQEAKSQLRFLRIKSEKKKDKGGLFKKLFNRQ